MITNIYKSALKSEINLLEFKVIEKRQKLEKSTSGQMEGLSLGPRWAGQRDNSLI